MFAAGGLMGVKTGVSLLVGAIINYFIFAPYLIQVGIIEKVTCGYYFKSAFRHTLYKV